MASSASGLKSSRRQRERIVGSKRPGAWLTRRNKVLAGGSSSILSKALAPGPAKVVDRVDAPPRASRTSPAAGSRNSPSSRTWSTVMLRASPSPFSFGSRSSQRKSGWLPAAISCSDRVIGGSLDAGQVERRTRGLGQHPPRGSRGEARLADALAARRAARHGAAAASPTPRRIAPTARSWPRIMAAGPRARRAAAPVTSSGLPEASIRSAPAPALPPRSGGRRGRPSGDRPRAAADAVAAHVVAGAGPAPPSGQREHQGAVGQACRRCAKSLIARTSSMPSPPAPP